MTVLSDLAEVKGFVIDDTAIQMNQNNDITSVSKLATLGITKYNKE